MTDLPRALRESVADNRLVPFVGAGVSNSVRNKDGGKALPTWLELLQRGASELRDDGKPDVADVVETMVRALAGPNAKGMDPVGLAGTIRSNLTGNKWVEFLENNLILDSESIDDASLELPKEIWNLANNFVVTTNFDKVLNWTCPRSKDARNLDLDDCAGLADTLKGSFRYPTIWHLHGYIDNPSKLILTRDEYDQLYGPQKNDSQPYSAALLTLKSVFASRTMLFVGFSFSDDYVRQQLEWLASAFSGYNGEHFALVHRAEMDKASTLLAKLQVRAIQFDDFGPPLLDTIRTIAAFKQTEKAPKQTEKERPLAETVSPANPQPTPIDERWRATRAVRLMDQLGPIYILDPSYFFMDWNPAFEKLFAEPLGLYRGQHAQEFVRSLVNRGVVESRARQVFLPGNIPFVDMEPLFFRSEEFGVIELWKIASRIIDEEGNLAAWSVALNILSCEKMEALWVELKRVLDARVNWALYAPSYDKLLLNFDEYGELIKFVCSKVGGATQCADLGAGTGNGTLELLRQRADRIVWAIEPNEEMLGKLRSKVRQNGSDLGDRVHLMRQGLRSLGEFEDSLFDGAIMINVLYAVDQPFECLKEVARIMQSGGVLVLSTPHSETNVDRLFDAIRQNFTKKGKLGEFRSIIDDVRKRHDQMMNKIHRDTKVDIRNYLEQAGFAIEEWFDEQYSGAVVVVKAVKL
jgi:ubiquinone/menaquinone biosynthesis C-methylase UbiE/PAS domain-containing protein